MRYINSFLMFAWSIALIALFFGYEPSKFTIGCAFFICASQQLGYFLDNKVKR